MYVLFVIAGLYLSNFVLTPDLGILLLVLSVFAILDALALIEIRLIRARPLGTFDDFSAFQGRIDRLSKLVLWGGFAFAGLAVVIFAVRLLARGG